MATVTVSSRNEMLLSILKAGNYNLKNTKIVDDNGLNEADGNVLHQHSGDIQSKQILQPKQKCVLGVEESYGEISGSNWNLGTDGWSIEDKLFNVSTLTIGIKLFNDIVADLLNQDLITDSDIIIPADDTVGGYSICDDDYYDGREYFDNALHNFIPILEMEQLKQLQYDEDGIICSVSTTIKSGITSFDESRVKELIKNNNNNGVNSKVDASISTYDHSTQLNNDWDNNNNNNNGVNGKVVEQFSDHNIQLNNDWNNNNNGINGKVIEPVLNSDSTAQLCNSAPNIQLNLQSANFAPFYKLADLYFTISRKVYNGLLQRQFYFVEDILKDFTLYVNRFGDDIGISKSCLDTFPFIFIDSMGNKLCYYLKLDTKYTNNHGLFDFYPLSLFMQYLQEFVADSKDDLQIVVNKLLYDNQIQFLLFEDIDNKNNSTHSTSVDTVPFGNTLQADIKSKTIYNNNNNNNNNEWTSMSFTFKNNNGDCGSSDSDNVYELSNGNICKSNNKTNKIAFNTQNNLSSLNYQYNSIYKNYYKKKRGRKKSKYKWVIKNKLQNAHSKQFGRNFNDVPYVVDTTFCNVSDDSGSTSICSNSSSSDFIVNDSSGGSIFSNYLLTAPAPPCDPDLIGI